MKKCASILNVINIIAEVLVIIGFVGLVLGLIGVTVIDLSKLADGMNSFISIEGVDVNTADLAAFKPVLMLIMAFGIVACVFAFLGIRKLGKVLKECKAERPFSEVSCQNLKGCARLELIGGIVGCVGAIITSIMAGGMTLNGQPIGSTTISLNLGFLIVACTFYLLYHVAEYGRKLESRSL